VGAKMMMTMGTMMRVTGRTTTMKRKAMRVTMTTGTMKGRHLARSRRDHRTVVPDQLRRQG
jgi:hypothetical protein